MFVTSTHILLTKESHRATSIFQRGGKCIFQCTLIDSDHDNKLFPLDFCLQPCFLCPLMCTITKMFLVSAFYNLWHQSRIPLRTRYSCFCSLRFLLILMLGLPWVPWLALYPSLSYSWNERASRKCYTHNQNNLYPLFLLPMALLLFLLS